MLFVKDPAYCNNETTIQILSQAFSFFILSEIRTRDNCFILFQSQKPGFYAIHCIDVSVIGYISGIVYFSFKISIMYIHCYPHGYSMKVPIYLPYGSDEQEWFSDDIIPPSPNAMELSRLYLFKMSKTSWLDLSNNHNSF
jgi:hypothetical protein